MKRERPKVGTTKLVWDPVFEELMCKECKAILYFNLSFNRCPYCHREIVDAEERKTKSESRCGYGVVIK